MRERGEEEGACKCFKERRAEELSSPLLGVEQG
jgi:hypothetical protein